VQEELRRPHYSELGRGLNSFPEDLNQSYLSYPGHTISHANTQR